MTKTFSTKAELHAIVSICDSTDAARARLLAALNPKHFAGPETNELFVRVSGLVARNQAVPKLHALRLDPALSDNARDLLDAPHTPCKSEEDANALVDQLELYRKLRVIYNGTRDIIDTMREASPETVDKALAMGERMLLDARAQYDDIELVTAGAGENATPVVDRVLDQAKPDRIITGFKQFDEASGGFARTDLVLIAATTGGGKSVMANQLGVNAYLLQNRNVALVSFEMDEEEIYARIMSLLTEIPFDRIYLHRLSNQQVERCRHAWQIFTKHGQQNDCKFVIWSPTFEVTPNQIGAILKPGRFDEVLIDYVGLVEAEQKAALWENLGAITRSCKAMARQQRNVWIVMAQLDEETNKVKYSKAMRHHSSWVWKWQYGEEQEETNQITVQQDKTRNCKRFNFDLLANFSVMAFNDMVGSATTRQTINHLAGIYGMDSIEDELEINQQTGEVGSELPETGPELIEEQPVQLLRPQVVAEEVTYATLLNVKLAEVRDTEWATYEGEA